jgi:hypothetical protein
VDGTGSELSAMMGADISGVEPPLSITGIH